MFPMTLFDQTLAEYTRRVRQINCFGWMRESLPHKLKKRFGRR